MTLTPEQLDELEARAKAVVAGYPLTAADWKFIDSATPETVGHLVSVYRAALAWNEARDDVRAFADEIDRLHPAPITVAHEVRREALGGVVKARAVALEAALRGAP